MGIINRTRIIEEPDLRNYVPEYNEDGTEKHIILEGARFHVPYWTTKGQFCSVKNCELNREQPKSPRPGIQE